MLLDWLIILYLAVVSTFDIIPALLVVSETDVVSCCRFWLPMSLYIVINHPALFPSVQLRCITSHKITLAIFQSHRVEHGSIRWIFTANGEPTTADIILSDTANLGRKAGHRYRRLFHHDRSHSWYGEQPACFYAISATVKENRNGFFIPVRLNFYNAVSIMWQPGKRKQVHPLLMVPVAGLLS